MVAGHLQEKKGYFYLVLTYRHYDGRRMAKWISTGLPVKGNKKRAEELLRQARKSFTLDKAPFQKDDLFADFLEQWLEVAKSTIQLVTFSSYSTMAKTTIIPYFKSKRIILNELQAKDIQAFYSEQLKREKASTVIQYHCDIHRALKNSEKTDLIPSNPASKVDRPRQDRFLASFYDSNEVNQLFEISKGTKLEIPILLGAFYGLRRSEVIGLKWSAIDFERDVFVIRHTVSSFNLDGKKMVHAADTTKTKSSMRTLPLIPQFKERLLEIKAQQSANRTLCGKSYCKEFLDYVCVNEVGERTKPEYLTTAFPRLLEKNGMRKIRFHDLRHSCASLLLANGVPMKQIQEWLGHSDFSTTANIYAHLDFNSKLVSAQAMLNGLKLPTEVEAADSLVTL